MRERYAWSSFIALNCLYCGQIEKEEQAAAEKAIGKEEFQGEWSTPAAAEFTQPEVADWSEGVAVPSVPIQQFPARMFLE